MILKIFTQPNCPKCPPAKRLAGQLKAQGSRLKVEVYNVQTVDGLAEGAFYQVMATPTILLCDDKGKIIKDWRGETPTLSKISAFLK